MPKTSPNLKPYETQPPTTSQHTHLKSSTCYKFILRKNTPATHRTISPPPWQNPLNPDPCTNPKPNTPTQQHTLDYYLTKNHCTAACHKASAGKAPGPDAIPNEILKHLAESAHDLLYLSFRLMARYSYTKKNGALAPPNLFTNPTNSTPTIPPTKAHSTNELHTQAMDIHPH